MVDPVQNCSSLTPLQLANLTEESFVSGAAYLTDWEPVRVPVPLILLLCSAMLIAGGAAQPSATVRTSRWHGPLMQGIRASPIHHHLVSSSNHPPTSRE